MFQSPNSAVVHLIYVPFGLNYFEKFITSYKAFKAGATHKLFLVFKGFIQKNEIDRFITLARQFKLDFEVLFYEMGGFDIDAYWWAAQQVKSKYIFFINTKSIILAENWLKFFEDAANKNTKSVIGATASWQSYLSSVFEKNTWQWEKNKSFKQNFDKYKLLLKAGTLWRLYFAPFPNPHLRTNAFMINRELFLSLRFPNIKKKLDAYRFESGRNGFSRQLIEKGYQLLLLDRNGNTYTMQNWAAANVFWQSTQHNLLISDNQTELFAEAGDKEKKILSFLAWGEK